VRKVPMTHLGCLEWGEEQTTTVNYPPLSVKRKINGSNFGSRGMIYLWLPRKRGRYRSSTIPAAVPLIMRTYKVAILTGRACYFIM
jgi:hypothetical protein